MPAFRPRVRAFVVGASVFALAAVAAGGAFAASNPTTLYACYDAYGNVKMGDTAQCKLATGGRLVSWSTAGVPGPAGATGASGPAGPTGPTGPTGPSGVRAWAKVNGDGTVFASSGNVAVDYPYFGEVGHYCVAVAGLDAPAPVAITPGREELTAFSRVNAVCGFDDFPAVNTVVETWSVYGDPTAGPFTIVIY